MRVKRCISRRPFKLVIKMICITRQPHFNLFQFCIVLSIIVWKTTLLNKYFFDSNTIHERSFWHAYLWQIDAFPGDIFNWLLAGIKSRRKYTNFGPLGSVIDELKGWKDAFPGDIFNWLLAWVGVFFLKKLLLNFLKNSHLICCEFFRNKKWLFSHKLASNFVAIILEIFFIYVNSLLANTKIWA